jgi:hypothetical protein
MTDPDRLLLVTLGIRKHEPPRARRAAISSFQEIAALAIFVEENGRARPRAPPGVDLSRGRTSI